MFGDYDVYLNIKLIWARRHFDPVFKNLLVNNSGVASQVVAARLKSLFNKHNIW